ncbi:MAG: hypothetical protein LQ347_005890 [Umbilicaria vellea]|nr:MAG: hypothetical protein LQ347_005890 [Umbilicaria vellea]
MPSLLPCMLFAASVLAAPAQVERSAPMCNADNCLRAFQNPAASVAASSFCSAYIPAATTTNPATITTTPTVTKTNTVPAMTFTTSVEAFAPKKKFNQRDVATGTSSAQNVQTAGPYTLLGCYREATQDGRALNGAGNQNVTSVEECASYCSSRGQNGPSKYMAVEYFRECYCDDVFNESAMKQESLNSCNTVCDGDNAEDCGGDAFLDLYELSSSVTGTPAGPSATGSVTPPPPASSPSNSQTTTSTTSSSATTTSTTDSSATTTKTTSPSATTTSETSTSQSTTSATTTSQSSSTSQTATSVASTSQTTTSQTTTSQSTTATSSTSTSTPLSVTTTAPPTSTTPAAAGSPTAKTKVPVAFTTQCVVDGKVDASRISSACSCAISGMAAEAGPSYSEPDLTELPPTRQFQFQFQVFAWRVFELASTQTCQYRHGGLHPTFPPDKGTPSLAVGEKYRMATNDRGGEPHDLHCLTIEELEKLAAERMDKQTRDYYNEGADSSSTLLENIQAYKKYRIRPRVLRDISLIDTSASLFGTRTSIPLGVAPTAMQCLAHPDGELATARACRKAGIPMGLSSFATTSLEDVASASGDNPLVLQLYLFEERANSAKLIARAKAAGYKAVFLTVDTPMLGRRNLEIRNRFKLPKPYRIANFTEEARSSGAGASIMDGRPSSEADDDKKRNGAKASSAAGYHDGQQRRPPQGPITFHTHAANPTLNWERDIAWLKRECGASMQVWLKGIATAEDTLLARQHGIDGIVVSNHGGRQLNGALATLDALPEIVAAAAGKILVHVDGGIRHGTDVFKALALGADFVWLGRPVLWGLAYKGQDGVELCLRLLRDELRLCMGLAGTVSCADISKEYLVKVDRSGFVSRL